MRWYLDILGLKNLTIRKCVKSMQYVLGKHEYFAPNHSGYFSEYFICKVVFKDYFCIKFLHPDIFQYSEKIHSLTYFQWYPNCMNILNF